MDSQGWPEPVVPVQSLSESGLMEIPANYVKPPSERPHAVSFLDGPEEGLKIPIIDLGGLAGDSGERQATMQEMWDACKEWGFFQVVNHGVSLDLVEKMRKLWKEFFHLPMEEKKAYANSPKTYEGYGSRLGVAKDAILDWTDYFFFHLYPDSVKNLDKWPLRPETLRGTTEEYGRELVKLCRVLLKVLSIGLGLDEGYLQKVFGGDDIGACMRVGLYPKCPQPELTLGLSPHSDYGGLTILLADERVNGLQVRKGDAWVTVQPAPGAFTVNVGDQIQVISNSVYRSVEHRVIANSVEERLSLAFFYNPRGDLAIGPAPELVTPQNPPLYRTIIFEEYRWYMRNLGLRGKLAVESLKTK
ncbi:jasmonate-induced oxygenase 2 isoform X1 [Elaeis guineensis]|uniref:Probable 2-oxoglutarate-dependent dioxygenase At5g05600 isoform X1 n=1 Tax=Elaeis guineensis var. tenera TaxID=51953 RepID=A0A6I9R911_ELAGV|nr:probable 2-oxoglutarate-dependent dioxygenase At5g05600 isoform X1 [Elaeis guineensis]